LEALYAPHLGAAINPKPLDVVTMCPASESTT
jgi:hypothetical protein